MIPSFHVPAQYFYALAASMPPDVSPEVRYRLACLSDEKALVDQLRKARDNGVIDPAAAANVVSGATATDPAVTIEMAARRLRALGQATGPTPVCAPGVGLALVTAYAAYKTLPTPLDDPAEDILLFWKGNPAIPTPGVMDQPALALAHLELALCAVTQEPDSRPLINHVKAAPPAGVGLTLDSVKNLDPTPWPGAPVPGLDFGDWLDVFTAFPADLPAITAPGTFEERVGAFVRRLRKFFDVANTGIGPIVPVPGAPSTLDRPSFDPLDAFFAAYTAQPGQGGFVWGDPFDDGALAAAIAGLPLDARARRWLEQAVRALNALYAITDIVTVPALTGELHFSLTEALYARGFTSAADVAALSPSDFADALIGTPAYPYAALIYAKAGGTGGPPVPAPGDFAPVNADGTLTDCLPPCELSPLGDIAYLHDLLGLSTAATCDDPLPNAQAPKLGELVSPRRGDLGALAVTCANAETPLPVIDLVNECLESMAAGASAAGVVYDTAVDEYAGHRLRELDAPPDESRRPFEHDPQTLFGALPEHSSPATPVAAPAAYAALASDFSSPLLPYAQALDVNRTYLGALGTSRFSVMRCFREDITEFVLDPEPPQEPAAFQRHLWRYPVRIDVAREYLRISPEEYDLLFTKTPAGPALQALYGFLPGDANWSVTVRQLSEFLHRTGLTYCEFVELWRSEFVKFHGIELAGRGRQRRDFPECEPCCLEQLVIVFADLPADVALARLAVLIRLWRKLRQLPNAGYSFAQLADIAAVLGLFDAAGDVNPDFVRQLAAFQLLRDDFRLELSDPADPAAPGATGAARTHILALWVPWAPAPPAKWDWALGRLIEHVERHARSKHDRQRREPEFLKLLESNLTPLSRLAGFDPTQDDRTWHAKPSHTLRFIEVLSKLYASEFGIGEVIYLFTADSHLAGDDPFPLAAANETIEIPLDHPDDERDFSLWRLRRKLLDARPTDEEAEGWTWMRIAAAMREELGYAPPGGGADPLTVFGGHFFPDVLERQGIGVGASERRFAVPLLGSAAGMWNTPDSPFFYFDAGPASVLRAELPLRDEAVLTKLSRIRPLGDAEMQAVRDLYHAPRLDLARFAFLFPTMAEADARLIQEPDQEKRWAYFRGRFARFHARCRVIAAHLAEHVQAVTGRRDEGTETLAWKLLVGLLGDENRADPAPWERDDGTRPPVHWNPPPTGGAFAAIAGLVGTGLLGEYRLDDGATLVWREVRGPTEAFGALRDEWNVPVPTLVPALDFDLSNDRKRWAQLRNGVAMAVASAKRLGGVQSYSVTWTGVLLVEEGGAYRFWSGGPTPDGERPSMEGLQGRQWRVTLRRGQKVWLLISHAWPHEEDCPESVVLPLKRGAYDITIEFVRCPPTDDELEDEHPLHTGFQLKYEGPDTEGRVVTIPRRRLYLAKKDTSLEDGVDDDAVKGIPRDVLRETYVGTLRDIRRTYQRAFKALLFAHRFDLSAERFADYAQSEIGHMLDHPDKFAGLAFYEDGGAWHPHRANFDFNLLPLLDEYLEPPAAQDDRVEPSLKREQALFDVWERTFDYTVLRLRARKAPEHPVWLLFDEAVQNQPDNPAQLLRHANVDLTHAGLVLDFWPAHAVSADDLADERWAIRVWRADLCVRHMVGRFMFADVRDAEPDLWAADDPGAPGSGNENLTKVVRAGLIESGPPRRYEDLKRLNDGLRTRARDALVAYLCGMDRVPLPWPGAGFAHWPEQLSELLLIDVEAGVCERASRVEDGVSAVQAFVQRARLGLEPPWAPSPEFVALWDGRYSTFRIWQRCVRRSLYRENWIEWAELEQARRSESFRFLEDQLRRVTLTIPVPGGLEYWDAERPPAHPGLALLQARVPSSIRLLDGPREGLNLLGTPERSAQRSWLAPIRDQGRVEEPPPEEGGGVILAIDSDVAITFTTDSPIRSARLPRSAPPPVVKGKLPLWLEAAIRLGVRFVRVAAAGVPPASQPFEPRPLHEGGPCACCAVCGRVHPAVVDEYYFWLTDTRWYDAVQQEPDWPGWHEEASLPALLLWPSEPMVHLSWARVHDGEVMQPRRSVEGVRIASGSTSAPEIEFDGRNGDSLLFTVIGGVAPPGYAATPPGPGFRYDIADDAAIVLPQVLAGMALPPFSGGLSAYPYFAYFAPGAPLFPLTPFSEAVTVASALRAHCRFEAALKWYALAFDPLHGDDRWCLDHHREPERPPRDDRPTPPRIPGVPEGANVPVDEQPPEVRSAGGRRQPIRERGSSARRRGRGADASSREGRERREGREEGVPPERPEVRAAVAVVPYDDAVCCHHVDASPAVARNRLIILEYLETLLAWGDCLMGGNAPMHRHSPESFQQARLIYDTAAKILGPMPVTVRVESPEKPKFTIATFKPDQAPINPRLLSLYERIDDRLALIHACQNGRRLPNGRPRTDMPYFGDDPVRDGWTAAPGACGCGPEDCCCCGSGSPYRFTYLVQKANELAAETRSLGAALLSAFEKGDAEYLAYVRAGHEQQILTLMRAVRQEQWRDADWQVKALQKSKEIAQTNRRYYATLLANGLNVGELDYQDLTTSAISSIDAATATEAIATILGVIPDIFVGTVNFVQLAIGTKLANVFQGISRISMEVAQILTTTAGLSLTQAGWARREEEWMHQVEIFDLEIEQIERQILAAERRRSAALLELNVQQRQIEHAGEVLDILRDKFTNHQLYLWLQRETAALYYQMYELADCVARQAERAFNFERGFTTRHFVPQAPWEDLREGLLAGERLQLATRSMEAAYLCENVRQYELTKHVSLRMHFAHAFLQLKLTGQCVVELPEWLFDLDYPGHYMRRIKNVTITIPSVVGPYSGVHCRLTLLSSATRVDPRLRRPVEPCCEEEQPPPPPPPGCACWPAPRPAARKPPRPDATNNGYVALPDDPRIVRRYAAKEAIATSSAQNDSGMFELNFRDERYFPFEFEGAVSRWRIEVPFENNYFPIDTMSDVLLHVNYVASEMGDPARAAAREVARAYLPDAGQRVFDLKREMPDEWSRFVGRRETQRFELRLSRDMFPYLPTDRDVYVTGLELFAEARGAAASTHREVEFHVAHEHGCGCAAADEREFPFVGGAHWPGFYHGMLDVRIGPVRGEDPRYVGRFVFEERLEEISRAFLVVRYETA